MDKKVKSKAMIQILDRIRAYGEFVVVVFGNELILNESIPVEQWPIVHCLISFSSSGFPLQKVIDYVQLRKPFCVNDLPLQELLKDRQTVYRILESHAIPTPQHFYWQRNSPLPAALTGAVADTKSDAKSNTAASAAATAPATVSKSRSNSPVPKPTATGTTTPPPAAAAAGAGAGNKSTEAEDGVDTKTAAKPLLSLAASSDIAPPPIPLLTARSVSGVTGPSVGAGTSVVAAAAALYGTHAPPAGSFSSLVYHESEECIEDTVTGQRLYKPFVEKPFDAENHRVTIYYPKKLGGGSRRLFRKVANRSSRYFPLVNQLRTKYSYVYEALLKNGKDLKVYTLGPGYAHGETRKSPVVDGVVERDPDDKELRLLTKLTEEEKQIAAKICVIFKQNICGFDIIRWKGRSYVIDVNGWSFVKGNQRYYDKCARILRKMFLNSKQGRAALALVNVPVVPPLAAAHPHPTPATAAALTGAAADVATATVTAPSAVRGKPTDSKPAPTLDTKLAAPPVLLAQPSVSPPISPAKQPAQPPTVVLPAPALPTPASTASVAVAPIATTPVPIVAVPVTPSHGGGGGARASLTKAVQRSPQMNSGGAGSQPPPLEHTASGHAVPPHLKLHHESRSQHDLFTPLPSPYPGGGGHTPSVNHAAHPLLHGGQRDSLTSILPINTMNAPPHPLVVGAAALSRPPPIVATGITVVAPGTTNASSTTVSNAGSSSAAIIPASGGRGTPKSPIQSFSFVVTEPAASQTGPRPSPPPSASALAVSPRMLDAPLSAPVDRAIVTTPVIVVATPPTTTTTISGNAAAATAAAAPTASAIPASANPPAAAPTTATATAAAAAAVETKSAPAELKAAASSDVNPSASPSPSDTAPAAASLLPKYPLIASSMSAIQPPAELFLTASGEPLDPSHCPYGDHALAAPSGTLVDSDTSDVLRALVAVFRHADRTPKQKIKVKLSDEEILRYLPTVTGLVGKKECKLKNKHDLKTLLKVIDMLIKRYKAAALAAKSEKEKEKANKAKEKAEPGSTAIAAHVAATAAAAAAAAAVTSGSQPPLTDKPTTAPAVLSKSEGGAAGTGADSKDSKSDAVACVVPAPADGGSKKKDKDKSDDRLPKLTQIHDVLTKEYGGTKVQIKPAKVVDGIVQQVTLICKWGGEMTHAGIGQAKQYAPVFWDDVLPPPLPTLSLRSSSHNPKPASSNTATPAPASNTASVSTGTPIAHDRRLPNASTTLTAQAVTSALSLAQSSQPASPPQSASVTGSSAAHGSASGGTVSAPTSNHPTTTTPPPSTSGVHVPSGGLVLPPALRTKRPSLMALFAPKPDAPESMSLAQPTSSSVPAVVGLSSSGAPLSVVTAGDTPTNSASASTGAPANGTPSSLSSPMMPLLPALWSLPVGMHRAGSSVSMSGQSATMTHAARHLPPQHHHASASQSGHSDSLSGHHPPTSLDALALIQSNASFSTEATSPTYDSTDGTGMLRPSGSTVSLPITRGHSNSGADMSGQNSSRTVAGGGTSPESSLPATPAHVSGVQPSSVWSASALASTSAALVAAASAGLTAPPGIDRPRSHNSPTHDSAPSSRSANTATPASTSHNNLLSPAVGRQSSPMSTPSGVVPVPATIVVTSIADCASPLNATTSGPPAPVQVSVPASSVVVAAAAAGIAVPLTALADGPTASSDGPHEPIYDSNSSLTQTDRARWMAMVKTVKERKVTEKNNAVAAAVKDAAAAATAVTVDPPQQHSKPPAESASAIVHPIAVHATPPATTTTPPAPSVSPAPSSVETKESDHPLRVLSPAPPVHHNHATAHGVLVATGHGDAGAVQPHGHGQPHSSELPSNSEYVGWANVDLDIDVDMERHRMEQFRKLRLAFLNGMKVYSSDEARVRASSQAFFVSTLHNAYNITAQNSNSQKAKLLKEEINRLCERDVDSSSAVQTFLSDTTAATKEITAAKQLIKTLINSKERFRFTDDNVIITAASAAAAAAAAAATATATAAAGSADAAKPATGTSAAGTSTAAAPAGGAAGVSGVPPPAAATGTADDKEKQQERAEREEEEKEQKLLDERALTETKPDDEDDDGSKKEVEEVEPTAPTSIPGPRANKKKKEKKKKKKEKKRKKSQPLIDPAFILALNAADAAEAAKRNTVQAFLPQAMTDWGVRCLRWMREPKETMHKVYSLMKEFQTTVHSICEVELSDHPSPPAAAAVTSGQPAASPPLKPAPAAAVLDLKTNASTDAKGSPSATAAGDDDAEAQYAFEDGDEEIVGVRFKIKRQSAETYANSHLLCQNETLLLMRTRWDQLVSGFYDPATDTFDSTKIPDVYDCIKYDVLHNYYFLVKLHTHVRPLYRLINTVADFVIPQEFGVYRTDKLSVATRIAKPLLNRIVDNLESGLQARPQRRVNLYFSSESHIHALRNVLLLLGCPLNHTVATTLEAMELNYLSHAVLRLYEDRSVPSAHPARFYVNVQFSPGAALDPFIFAEEGHVLPVSRPVPVNGRIPLQTFKALVQGLV